MFKIKVLYFAGVKDITAKEYDEINVDKESITLNELSNTLIAKYGDKLQGILSTSMYAINMEYIDKQDEISTIIRDASEVAIIPPVSGG